MPNTYVTSVSDRDYSRKEKEWIARNNPKFFSQLQRQNFLLKQDDRAREYDQQQRQIDDSNRKKLIASFVGQPQNIPNQGNPRIDELQEATEATGSYAEGLEPAELERRRKNFLLMGAPVNDLQAAGKATANYWKNS